MVYAAARLFIASLIVAIALQPAYSECCDSYVTNLGAGNYCRDCKPVGEGTYCGVGSCNIFGCNCDGGCRETAKGLCPWKAENDYDNCGVDEDSCEVQKVQCKSEGVCDWSSGDVKIITNEPNSVLHVSSSCRATVTNTFGPNLNTTQSIQSYFDCVDSDGDGKITIGEMCVELLCDAEKSTFTEAAVIEAVREASGGLAYLTASQFDASLASNGSSSGAVANERGLIIGFVTMFFFFVIMH